MRTWNLPDRLVEAVDTHHELEKAREFKKRLP
jgi:HD-like signal output (HDOD) protein